MGFGGLVLATLLADENMLASAEAANTQKLLDARRGKAGGEAPVADVDAMNEDISDDELSDEDSSSDEDNQFGDISPELLD